MKKKKLLMIGCIAVVLLLSVSVAISASTKKSTEMLAGELYHDLQTQSDETVLATYRGQPITADVVAYTVSMNELYGDDTTEISASTDKVKHAIDGIVESMILLEEAERQGLEATDEEIEATIENAKLAYEIPEGKQMLDEYCAAMEISFEEYLEILAEQSPRVIARQKLRDAYGQAIARSTVWNLQKSIRRSKWSRRSAEQSKSWSRSISSMLSTIWSSCNKWTK